MFKRTWTFVCLESLYWGLCCIGDFVVAPGCDQQRGDTVERNQVGHQERSLHHPDGCAGSHHHLSLLHHRIYLLPGRFPDGSGAGSKAYCRR